MRAGRLRQGNCRTVKPGKNQAWELHDVTANPGETKNLAVEKPEILARLLGIAKKEHEPAREGTFDNTELQERDRRAKYGVLDDPSYLATPSGIIKKSNVPAKPN